MDLPIIFLLVVVGLTGFGLGVFFGGRSSLKKHGQELHKTIEAEQHTQAQRYFDQKNQELAQQQQALTEATAKTKTDRLQVDRLLSQARQSKQQAEQTAQGYLIKLEREQKRRQNAVHSSQRYKEKVKLLEKQLAEQTTA